MWPAQSASSTVIPKIRSHLLLFLLLIPCLVAADGTDRLCFGGNYTLGDPFGRNLDRLLLSLADSVAATGFSNSSVVDPSNQPQVFGLVLCRGDVPADECRSCASDMRLYILNSTYCANKTSGIVWWEKCFLRYSETDFVGVVGAENYIAARNVKRNDPESQFGDVKAFMYTLIQKCSENGRLFATEAKTQRDATVRYGLAQCTRDLNSSQCSQCLNTAIDRVTRNSFIQYIGWRVVSASCILRYENYSFFTLPPPPAPTPRAPINPASRLAPPPVVAGDSVNDGGSGTRRRIIVFAVCATIGLLLAGIALLVLWQKKRRDDGELRRFNSEMTSQMNFSGLTEEERSHDLPHFTFKVVQVATKNFSEENELGRGGFGPVYKGELNGRWVAVKRLSHGSGQGLKEFMIEVVLIAKLQHKNLVRLLGCCVEKGEKMLIYEFMPNGSLDSFLNDSEKRASLNWEKRFNIIMGTARGLLYLHQDSRLSVIHRDLKAANVLLDEHMTAKISDFGTARIFIGDKDAKSTNLVVGTYGYMAPEYAVGGLFSVKSDVYSFGVLLLEIIVGQTFHAFHLFPMGHTLIAYAWTRWSKRMASELIDPKLGEITDQVGNQILRCIHIGLLCIQEDPEERPTMSIILNMLGSELTLPAPKQPPMVFGRSFTHMSSGSMPKSTTSSSNSAITANGSSTSEAISVENVQM